MKRKRVPENRIVFDFESQEYVEERLVSFANGEQGKHEPILARTASILDVIAEVNAIRMKDQSDSEEKKKAKQLGEFVGGEMRSAFPIIPMLEYSAKSETTWDIAWGVPDTHFTDFIVISSLLDLARVGRLSRFLKCDCGRYFLARVDSQRFHSAKCRERAFKSTPEWKKYRNEKAREYYRLHKSGKVK